MMLHRISEMWNGHEIFKNNRLTSQFLSNYTGIQMLAGVRPEDIEDVTERYHAFLGIEFESDTIKKVCLHQADGTPDREIYVISLIEHKSAVDYDVAMQLFRYMSVIWYDYRMEQNKKKKDANRRKAFRYPLIIPFVYYEGKEKWTARPAFERPDRVRGRNERIHTRFSIPRSQCAAIYE
ncbi:MAG: Rpn family recombination-promoting nuclease/putative transposase [Ruminococcus sp.]